MAQVENIEGSVSEPKKKLIIMAGPGEAKNIVYNSLKEEFFIESLIVEQTEPLSLFLKRRIKKLGPLTVSGQILFKMFVVPYLAWEGKQRLASVYKEYSLDRTAVPLARTIPVRSVNSPEAIAVLRESKPDAVVICGTRIVAKSVLSCIEAPFLNMHAGITPLYRGVHGAYWALVQKKPSLCGVTVHVLDPGIDTGSILGQCLIRPTGEDSFVTYPLLQLAAGMPMLKQVIRCVFQGNLRSKPAPEGTSRLWSHPTAWRYLLHRLRDGVR